MKSEAFNKKPRRQTSHTERTRPHETASRPDKQPQRPHYRLFTAEKIAARQASVPQIHYPDLPVTARREEIKKAIAAYQVVVIAGETGSGKTTQLPKMCLELGRGITGMIGHTQPRRIAARSVAARMCEELGVPLGQTIGYQVRFTDDTSDNTLVKVMTDGILLAEIQSDPLLRAYDTLIIDEAHERSLNIDFLLGYLASILPRRPDLKLIITSATIDTERFAEHFGARMIGGGEGVAAPIIEVSGRTYPVEIRYRPLEREEHSDNANDSPSRRHEGATQSRHHGSVTQPRHHEAATQPRHHEGATQPRHHEERSDVVVSKPNTPTRLRSIDHITGILEAADELMAEGDGDILVFLSGEGEIRDAQAAFADHLRDRYIEPGGTSRIPGAVEVLPLFARLSSGEQQRIFSPHTHRRIILATNIAETSLTVPSIRYVIDVGTARISRYSNKTKVQRLPIEAVSKASANQRAGRCGRVADGICIRLYSEDDFTHRDEFTQPEIQRTSLASVIMQMLALGLGDIAAFPFIDPPDSRAIRAGMQLLEEIGAVDSRPVRGKKSVRLTRIGWKLARLPLDPRLGRMLIEGERNGCASEMLVLVAALSVQDVRERPVELQEQADQLHARFNTTSSDFLAYLTLWRYLRTQQRELSGSAFRRLCRGEFINYMRWREWTDVVRQLESMVQPLGLHIRRLSVPSPAQIERARRETDSHLGASPMSAAVIAACREVGRSSDTPSADAIHRSLLVGLLSNIGVYQPRTRDFEGARGTHFVIWPGSGLHRRTPEWVMAAELVETSRLFARSVAAIRGEWVENAAKRLVKRSYSEAYWSAKQGAAMCREKVTLYGITLAADRPVLLARVPGDSAREVAREMFIKHGLVEGDWRNTHAFMERNAQAVADAEQAEQRLRRHGLVADSEAMFRFYDERIPASVVSGTHFDGWWKKECAAGRGDILDFSREFLLGDVRVDAEDFPSTIRMGDIDVPVTYTFNPGGYGDGVSVDIPVTILGQVTSKGCDWLVPGMLSELILATLRALPKRIRRQLVPAPDVARALEPAVARYAPWSDDVPAPHVENRVVETARVDKEALTAGLARIRGDKLDELAMAIATQQATPRTQTSSDDDVPTSFRGAFARCVRDMYGVTITGEDWKQARIPDHVAMHYRVLSERGAILEESTSLEELQESLRTREKSAMQSVVKGAVAQALLEGRAARRTSAPKNDMQTGVGEAASVENTAGDTSPAGKEAQAHMLEEWAAKAYEVWRLDEGRIVSRWSGDMALSLAGLPYSSRSSLVADMQQRAAFTVCHRWVDEQGSLREQDYDALLRWGRAVFEDEVYRIAQQVARISERVGELDKACSDNSSLAMVAVVADVKKHMASLVYEGFVAATPYGRLEDIERYCRADIIRIDKARVNPSKDDSLAWHIQQVEAMVDAAERDAHTSGGVERVRQARWLVEELRVSVFAQQLGTREKVSAKRIAKFLAQ